MISIDSGRVDLDRREVVRGERTVELRAKEAELLRYLATRPGRTVSREELFEQVWGYHGGTRSRTLDTTVRRLRAAIEADPAQPRHLLTEVGVGYRFVGLDPPDGARRFLEAGAARVRALLGRRVATRVVLYGPHGIGKRTWAIEAASTFPGRVVQAAGPEALAAVAQALGVDPSGDPARLRRRVEAVRAGSSVLVLLVDVPLDEVVRWSPPVLARQVAPPPPHPGYDSVPVEPLPREAAQALLARRVPPMGQRTGLERLVDLLGGIPLALELAAAQLRFCDADALADALIANPARLYEGAADGVARTATIARSRLDEVARSALDAVASFGGPVPLPVMVAAAGGVGVLAHLRDQGWLAETSAGGWTVPVSLRSGSVGAGRERAVEALLAVVGPTCDPLCGPGTWEALATLAALAPTLNDLDDPRLGPLLVWSHASAGARGRAAEIARGLRESAPLVYGRWAPDPFDERLRVVEAGPPSVARDALRSRLLRQLGRVAEAAAVPEPVEADGVAVGEWWYQRHQLAGAQVDVPQATVCARKARSAWRRWPVHLERARGATAYLELVSGHVVRSERDYLALAASPHPITALEGELGLGFVGLMRGDPERARSAAERGTAPIPRLDDPVAVSAWNQVALLWREVGELDRVTDAVILALDLLDAAGPGVAFEGALHTTLGAALLDAGRPDEALMELVPARELYHRVGLTERARYADVLARIARELRGDDVSAEWAAEGRGGDGRLDHLVAAFAGHPTPEARAFADRTADVALRGVLVAMAGEEVPAAIRACSYEARVAARLQEHRCHTGSHAPGPRPE